MARVALVLGSGGARGYAHLGAFQELQERGHEVVAVSGTSMGAVVGGLVATGKVAEYVEWVRTLPRRRVVALAAPTLGGGGAATAERLMAALDDLFGDVAIEDLPIPYTAVATDLVARREVWFQRGPLLPAIRASIAIPGLFTPAVVDGRVLVDGGLLNPLPLEPMASANADFTLAVSLQGPREPHEPTSPTRGFAVRTPGWAADLRRRFRRADGAEETAGEDTAGEDTAGEDSAPEDGAGEDGAPDGDGSGGDVEPRALTEAELDATEAVEPTAPTGAPDVAEHSLDVRSDLRTTEVIGMSFDAMQSLITRYRLAALPPDVLVTVPLSAARTLDFHRAEELIALGRTLTAQALDAAER